MRAIQRNGVVDRLRGVAILLVLGLHFFGLWAYVNGGDEALHGFHKAFGHGYLGVNMFFAISGYLIASTSVARGADGDVRVEVGAFYVRRATRILPLLLVTLAIGAAAVASVPTGATREFLFDMPGTEFTTGFWASTLGFAFNWYRLGVTGTGGAHGWLGLHWDVLWSLAVEEQFYVLFPWVVAACGTLPRLRRVLWAVMAVAIATRVSLSASGADWLTSATNSVSCFDALSMGVLVALAAPWSVRASRTAAAAGCLGLVACYGLGYAGFGLPATGMAAATALVIQSSRTPGTYPALTLSLPLLGSVGLLSYGLYLLQAVAFALLPRSLFAVDPFLGLAAAVCVGSMIAWLSFNVFERPVERVLRRAALGLMAGRSKARSRTTAVDA